MRQQGLELIQSRAAIRALGQSILKPTGFAGAFDQVADFKVKYALRVSLHGAQRVAHVSALDG